MKDDGTETLIVVGICIAIVIIVVVATLKVAPPSSMDEHIVGTVIRVDIGNPQYTGDRDHIYTVKLDDGNSVQYLDAWASTQRFHIGDKIQLWMKNGVGFYTKAELIIVTEK